MKLHPLSFFSPLLHFAENASSENLFFETEIMLFLLDVLLDVLKDLIRHLYSQQPENFQTRWSPTLSLLLLLSSR